MKANKLLISCCYGDRGYHKRDTEEVEAETEEIERETRNSECVYYIQYSGGNHCNQYYKYVPSFYVCCITIMIVIVSSN